ncbi:YppG family protein [Aquibacillus koreensis]|uniref:YppG family protein n=1 Tax=Aquibacillus koreensis TaxID=279446 RepID=A0A9X3WNU9_9BACI|nr:YppG family protein [Aquibacillus koreensis]MCT2534948.1 YppG family protein [Aquibacillus koreensis]MDC3422158.1 YppG family protein [Aquibacillus koreensis]
MNYRRVPYYPQQGYVNYPNPQQMGFYNQNNVPGFNFNQDGPSMKGNNPPPPTTPYEQFAKPNHPSQWFQQAQQTQQAQGQPWGQTPKGLMAYFQDKDGQLDIDKMLSTVGQLGNTYQQVSPIVKGLGSFVKGFK